MGQKPANSDQTEIVVQVPLPKNVVDFLTDICNLSNTKIEDFLATEIESVADSLLDTLPESYIDRSAVADKFGLPKSDYWNGDCPDAPSSEVADQSRVTS